MSSNLFRFTYFGLPLGALALAGAGFVPSLRHTTDDYVVVQALVARGLGVTLLPASALTAYRHPGVDVLSPSSLGTRSIGLTHRAGADQVPAVAVLMQEFETAAATPSDAIRSNSA